MPARSVLTVARRRQYNARTVPPGEAAHFISADADLRADETSTSRAVSIASVADLCARRPRFRAGRGRLADRDRRRALSRFHLRRRRQRARPRPSASGRGARPSRPRRSGTSPISTAIPGRRAAGRAAVRGDASPTPCSSAIPAPRRSNARSRWRANTSRRTASPSATASSPSRAPSTAARWRRSPPAGNKKYLEGFGPTVDGFDQVPFGDLEAVEDGDRRRRPRRS